MPTKQEYLDYIVAAGADMPGYLERSIKHWRDNFTPHNALFGYQATGGPASSAGDWGVQVLEGGILLAQMGS